MTSAIKQRAKDIVKADMTNILVGAGIFTLVSLLRSAVSGGIVGDMLSGFISSVGGACSACFYFRAYNRGHSDINDTYALLTDSLHMRKIVSIVLAMWIINTLVGIASTVIAFIPLIGVLAILIITLLVGYLLRIVWFLFVANPEYPTEYYLKGSVEYMGSQLLPYIGFAISVSFVPALIEILVSMFVGGTIAGIMCIPFKAYINLAIAGFVTNIIPDEWFNGTKTF